MATRFTLADGTATGGDLARLVELGHARARAVRGPVLVSLVERAPEVDPLALFAAGSAIATDRVLWALPSADFALAGVGVAYALEPEGRGRFERAGAAWRDLLRNALIESLTGPIPRTGPTLLGGFAFDPERPSTALWHGFPDARLVLPRLLLTIYGAESRLTLSLLVWSDSDPAAEAAALLRQRDALLQSAAQMPIPAGSQPGASPGEVHEVLPGETWRAAVAEGAATIRRGELEKVVLAREVRVSAEAPLDVPAALARLRESYPTCYVFAVARGERVFLGATPERLVEVRDRDVRATCLAGSIRRGATPEEDERLGADLLASAKNLTEHAIVVRALREALDGTCIEVEAPSEPALLTVRNVHHLYTPVTARLDEGATLLDLVARLHPTPAVGGFPNDAALAYIRQHEGLDRGWYAGPVGWVGRDGSGEFAVALRSALVAGREASLFGGCGIMGDSDPDAEYAETNVKLRPMLSALNTCCG